MCKGVITHIIGKMAKKSKAKLQQLIAKKERLQNLQPANITFDEKAPELPKPVAEKAAAPTTTKHKLATHHVTSELTRTVISVIIITVLLVAAVIFDRRQPTLNEFGSWLYQALHLQG